jgi:hypothetical protein
MSGSEIRHFALLPAASQDRGLVLKCHTDSYNQKIHPIKTVDFGVITLYEGT